VTTRHRFVVSGNDAIAQQRPAACEFLLQGGHPAEVADATSFFQVVLDPVHSILERNGQLSGR